MEKKFEESLSLTEKLRIDLSKTKGEIDRIIGEKILSTTKEMRDRNEALEN